MGKIRHTICSIAGESRSEKHKCFEKSNAANTYQQPAVVITGAAVVAGAGEQSTEPNVNVGLARGAMYGFLLHKLSCSS